VAVCALALGLACAVLLLRLSPKSTKQPSSAMELVPLIAMDGKQGWPAFSPDGQQVAFAEYEGQRPGIYTTLLGGERPLRLSEDSGDCCPAWSPDGQQIAFVRRESSARSIYTVAALGGAEHRLYTGAKRVWMYCDGVDWSPTGNSLAFAEVIENPDGSRISLLSLSDLTVKPLTSPTPPDFDCEPYFSPDGSSLAFVRGMAGGNYGDLFDSPVSGGNLKQLTFGNTGGTFSWTPNGQEIIFSSAMGGLQTLWRVSVAGGSPVPVTGVAGPAVKPSVSRRGSQLAYQQPIKNDNIWRIDLKDEKHSLGLPARAFSSRGFIYRPSFSPNGKKVAFESDRLGYPDVWVCDSDGTNCAQITMQHTTSGTARWSPNGRWLAFESVQKHFWQLFVSELPGGQPRLMKTGLPGYNGCPNWSRDAQWIYFCVGQGGTFDLWKLPFPSGGPPVRVTKDGGVYGVESDDGLWLYYADKPVSASIWKMPLKGGASLPVLDQRVLWFDWVLTHSGIYFINLNSAPNGRIEFLDFASHEITPIFRLEKPKTHFGGLALSPNGKTLYWGQTDRDDSYIMLVKDFR
jgi:Tol biopolymer transport system component